MADDIVERLRAEVAVCPGRGNSGHGLQHCAECCFGTGIVAHDADEERIMLLARDAADEIERLRAEVDHLQQQVDWWVQTHGSIYSDERALQDEIDRLQAENAALTAQRDSLQSLLDDQVVLANALGALLDHPHLSDEAIGRTLRARRQRHRDRLDGR